MSRPLLVGVLLAAGRGTRFDAQGRRNKLLEEIDGVAVVAHSATRLRAVVDRLVVVHSPGAAQLSAILSPIADLLTACTDAHLGMGHSLAHAVREARKAFSPDALLVALGDMPFVSPTTLRALGDLGHAPGVGQCIAAPRFNGQRGHPVLFGQAYFDTLERSSGDTGAASLLRNGPVQWIEVDDPGVIRDIDRPEDLPTPPSLQTQP